MQPEWTRRERLDITQDLDPRAEDSVSRVCLSGASMMVVVCRHRELIDIGIRPVSPVRLSITAAPFDAIGIRGLR